MCMWQTSTNALLEVIYHPNPISSMQLSNNITLCFSLHSVFHGFKATTMSAIFEPVCLGAVSRQLDI